MNKEKKEIWFYRQIKNIRLTKKQIIIISAIIFVLFLLIIGIISKSKPVSTTGEISTEAVRRGNVEVVITGSLCS